MDFELIELRYTIYRVLKEILFMKNDMKLIMESFNNWINEQEMTGPEFEEKLKADIEDLKKKIKEEEKSGPTNNAAKLKKELEKKEKELKRFRDSIPTGGDGPVKNPTEKDKEYEKELRGED